MQKKDTQKFLCICRTKRNEKEEEEWLLSNCSQSLQLKSTEENQCTIKQKAKKKKNIRREICIGCNQFAIRCNCTVQCYIYIAPANKKKKTANLPFTSNHLAMPTKSNNNKNNVCVHHFFPIHFNVIFVTFSRSKTKWMIMGCQTNDRVGR